MRIENIFNAYKRIKLKITFDIVMRESVLGILLTESSCTMPHILRKVLYLLSFLVSACNVYKCAKNCKNVIY